MAASRGERKGNAKRNVGSPARVVTDGIQALRCRLVCDQTKKVGSPGTRVRRNARNGNGGAGSPSRRHSAKIAYLRSADGLEKRIRQRLETSAGPVIVPSLRTRAC